MSSATSSIQSLGEAVRRHAAETPDRVAITFEGRSTSYQELDRASDRVTNGLLSLGIGPSDRIGILDKNSDRFIEMWLGLSKLNAVIVPINARLAGPEIEYVVNDANVKVLFIG